MNLVKEKLSDMGIRDDEAEFFIEGVKHGGKLVVVEASKEQFPAVKEILEKGQATNLP